MSEIAGGIREREARGWNREDGIARRELHEGSAGGNRMSEFREGFARGKRMREARGWNREDGIARGKRGRESHE